MAELRCIEATDPVAIREGLLESIARVEGVKRIVAFPDLHHTPFKEIPGSVAVGALGAFVPNFSSVNQNCGMAYIATGLAESELDAAALDRPRAPTVPWGAARSSASACETDRPGEPTSRGALANRR